MNLISHIPLWGLLSKMARFSQQAALNWSAPIRLWYWRWRPAFCSGTCTIRLTYSWSIQVYRQSWRISCQAMWQKYYWKNLSGQYENYLLQIEAMGIRLKMRVNKGYCVWTRWRKKRTSEKRTSLEKRKLIYSITDKPLCQASVVDGKAVNMRVDKAMILRNTGQELVSDHPWRNLSIGKSVSDKMCVTL